MRLRAKKDDNHREIQYALMRAGASVQDLSAVGGGCPDILVGLRGQNFLMEIKDGKKPVSKRKLTDMEKVFATTWRGQVCVVQSVDDALLAVGLKVKQ